MVTVKNLDAGMWIMNGSPVVKFVLVQIKSCVWLIILSLLLRSTIGKTNGDVSRLHFMGLTIYQ